MSGTVLRNALVVDGTGAPAHHTDVLVRDGQIAAVGKDVDSGSAERLDLDGLVLAPGFIDPHTHYDAQVLWDPDLTPSSWHGVTTVIMGNCGIGVAPTRPKDRDLITRSLVNVEGMAEAALVAGIDWCFETFPEYVAALRARKPRLNVELLLSHSPLRVYVMGEAAFEREANDDELAAMGALAKEAAAAGAVGVGTSRSPNHMADDGRPLPSRLATFDEVALIGRMMTEGRGRRAVIEVASGPTTVEELGALSKGGDATVTWTTILAGRTIRGRTGLEIVDDNAAAGDDLWPQVTCLPVRILFTLAVPRSALS
jgi:N-acyl-D-aspartate/D-glutamate deacylase